MIDKLKQVEDKLILDLLCKPDIWKSLLIDYHPPIVERCWTQIGNFRILLHFIHECEEKDALFHPHPWPSAMHVLEGTYEMQLGFGPGLEEPPRMCKILIPNGGIYYDMTHIDGWHSVRPVKCTCSTVMLTGPKWNREEIKSDKPLKELTPERKFVFLEYFLNYYRRQYQQIRFIENKIIQRGDWVELEPLLMTNREKKELQKHIGQKAFVIKRTGEGLIDIRFEDNDRVQLNAYCLKKLDELKNPKKTDIKAEDKDDDKDDFDND